MSPPYKRDLLKRWKKDFQRRVSCNCNLVFKGGKAIGSQTNAHFKKRRVSRETVDLTQYLFDLRWGVRREIVDLTKYLSGRGWKVKKLRGSNKGSRYEIPIVRCVKDDEESSMVVERMGNYSLRDIGHQAQDAILGGVCEGDEQVMKGKTSKVDDGDVVN